MRLVAPDVAPAGRRALFIEGEHREELERADAEILQIGEFLDEPGECAPPAVTDAGIPMAGEVADVQFVDDRPGEWRAQRTVILPIVRARIRHDALQCRRGVVTRRA